MYTKTIRKKDVALLKGLGGKPSDIAKELGITLEETIDMLKEFNLYNTKKTTPKQKEYTIFLVDDTKTEVTTTELETAN